MFGKYRTKGKGASMSGTSRRANTTVPPQSAGATLPRPATTSSPSLAKSGSLQTRPVTPKSSTKGFVFSAGMAGHLRTASAATIKDTLPRAGIFARSSADQLGSEREMAIRERAHTSREPRTRTSSNASSSHSSPLQRLSRVFSTQSTGYGSFTGSLSSLPVGLSGSSPSLVKLNESASTQSDEIVKRRSMSVLAREDLKPDDGSS
ncbi:hypothetical protein EC988_009992, partial [Linderina pennispora]